MNTWARPGKQCVCIDDDFGAPRWSIVPTRVPMLNELLTVSAVHQDSDGTWLQLAEIPSEQSAGGQTISDLWFLADCFRPIIRPTLEQDVALFAKIGAGDEVTA